jgi:hypothetical protein
MKEFFEYFNFIGILSDFVVPVKQHEVRAAHASGQLEFLPDVLIRKLSEIRHSQYEVDRVVLVELLDVCNFFILSEFF